MKNKTRKQKKKTKSKLGKLISVEILFIVLMGIFIGFGQFALTADSTMAQIDTHLDDIEKSIEKFDESEKIGKDNVDELLQIRADSMALMLDENIFNPTEDILEQYAEMLDVDDIYVVDENNRNIISTKGARDFDVERLTKGSQVVKADIDNERTVVLEMPMQYMNDVFKEAFSWRDSVKNIVVGRRGYTFMVEKDTGKISVHPDEKMIRKEVAFLGHSIKNDSDREYDLMVVGDDILLGGMMSVRDEKGAQADMPVSEEYIVCAVPAVEIAVDFFTNGLIYVMVFLLITILFLLFCFFSENTVDQDVSYQQRLFTYPFLAGLVVVCFSLFLSQINATSSGMLNSQMRADDAKRTIENYENIIDNIQEIYNQEYLIECRIAADILKKSPKLHTREGMREISELLKVDYTYLFDEKGRTVVTDSPFDHFRLSKDENAQSYAFRPLLEGVEYVVQEPMIDDSSGKWMQYVGVSIRNSSDLADGFAQIAINPEALEKILENVNISQKLDDINAGLKGFAMVIDDSGAITISPRKRLVGKTYRSVGIRKKQMTDGFSGYVSINNTAYFAAAKSTDDGEMVFVVIPRNEGSAGQGRMVVLIGGLALCCMLCEAFICRQKERSRDGRDMAGQKQFSKKLADDVEGGVKKFFGAWKIHQNESIGRRWNQQFLPWSARSPEQKVLVFLRGIISIFCGFIIFCYVGGTSVLYEDSILLYIMQARWEKGLNIFAVSACLMIICIIFFIVQIAQLILYQVAKISDTRTETVCHLLRSLLKYGAAISVFYFCLAQFGIDTKTLVASAGIMSIIVGLGAQKLIMDVIAGLFLVFENQFAVGDLVNVGGWGGRVVEIGIRTTKIADFENVKSFNNSEITGLINYMWKDVCTISSEIAVSYDEPLESLISLLKEEVPKLEKNISGAVEPPFFDGVTRLEDSGIVLVFRVMAKSDLKYPAERDFHRELLLLFERRGITVPYSHLTLDGEIGLKSKRL